MTNSRRSLRAAVAATSILLGSSALFAQETGTIGPPQLKDFQLQGERTTPPAREAEPAPKAQTPPATERAEPAAPRATERPRAAPAPRTREAAPVRSVSPAAETAPRPAPALEPAPQPSGAAPIPIPTLPPAPAPAPQAAAPATPAPANDGSSWAGLWFAIPAALGLAAFFLIGRRRRPAPRRAEAARDTAAAAAAPPPKPKAPPKPPEPRAQLKVEFVPERAAATTTEAGVEFQLVLTNVGDAVARNIRIDSRLFNASETAETLEFLNGPIHEQTSSPHVTIAPGGDLKLNWGIALPLDQIREIEMQGRRLFVPLMAAKVAWDWEGGTARESFSWLVGREPATPAAKMGGFRLDLGPRIYRQVGQRPMKLVA